jgi:hypothetical protein
VHSGDKGAEVRRHSREPWLSRSFALPKNEELAAPKPVPGLTPRAT